MSIFKKLFGEKVDQGHTPQFKALLDGSMESLQLRTQAHQDTWGLGKAEGWQFAQDTGEMIFTFPDKIVRAPAQIIGSFDKRTRFWSWSWANSTIPKSIKRDSIKVREYGKQHNIKWLTTAKWQAEENDCWLMAALACRLCNSRGAYRGPVGEMSAFFTFG